MSLIGFIKKNKLFSIFSIGFLIWITFLIILSFIAKREVIFLDAVASYPGTDVSYQYSSVLPWTRYLLEPFAALSYIFVEDYEWIIGFIIVFVILRIVYSVFRWRGLVGTEKSRLLLYPIKDIIRTSFIVFTVLVLTGFAIVGTLYATTGLYYVNLHFMLIVQIIIPVCFIVIGIKVVLISIKWFHPLLKLDYSKKKRYKKSIRQSKIRNLPKVMRREISYILGISLFLLGSNLLLISTYLPGHIIVPNPGYELGEDELLLDFHVHTTFSDGWLTPEERVMWYIDHGIDGAAFSDHDNLRGSEAAQAFVEVNNLDFIVIKAEEWTDHDRDTGLHMNIFGLNKTIIPLESSIPGGPMALNASDTIDYVKTNGGFITVNHYSGSPGSPYTYVQLYNWGVDGFEIVNGAGIRAESIRAFCLNLTGELGTRRLACMGGSDIHTNQELNTFTRIKLADPTNLTLANIFATLKNNTHQVVAIDLYPDVYHIPESLDFLNDIGFGIFEGVANYFANIDSFQVLSWIIWSCFGYLLIAFFYRQIKKLDLEKVRRKILIS